MVVIQEVSPVLARVIEGWEEIRECMRYRKVYYRQKQYKKERNEYWKSLLDRKGHFYSGHIERVMKWCRERDIECEVEFFRFNKVKIIEPALRGIEFRKDQMEALMEMGATGKGVWKAPTGSGKTVLIGGLISMYPDERVLVLVHTEELFNQTIEEFEKWWPDEKIGRIGCGLDQEEDITVGMIQTLGRRKLDDEFGLGWGIVIVDECFRGDCKVITSEGEKPIRDIRVGDQVLSSSGYSKVSRIFAKKISIDRMVRIRLSNGRSIACTEDHLFYCLGMGWIEAGDCQGNFLLPPAVGNRGGWQRSREYTWQGARREERQKVNGVGVESVEIYKPRSTYGFGSSDEKDSSSNERFMILYDLEVEKAHNYFVEGVLVHNCHHVGFGGQYEKVLSSLYAVQRFGLTATPPKKEDEEERLLAMEGLLGPLRGETGYKELEEEGVLAKPIVKVLWVPEQQYIKDLRGPYIDVYETGVVYNRKRNGLIIKTAKDLISQDLTVLIMVERVEHGEQLLKMAEASMPGTFVFLHGETPSKRRTEERQAFKDEKRRGVIATRIWTEGVNIKSVGAVINAVGGLKERRVLQAFGRGTRTTEQKKEVVLVDLFQSDHRYMLRHSGKRLCLFFELGWL